MPSTIEPAVTVISAGLVQSNSKRFTSRVDAVSTKSWELQIKYDPRSFLRALPLNIETRVLPSTLSIHVNCEEGR